MKRGIYIYFVVMMIVFAASGCKKPQNTEELEVIHPEASRIRITDIELLIEKSDLILIGEYTQETEQYFLDEEKESVMSMNRIEAKKVLKGDCTEKGIKVEQRYGVIEENGKQFLYTISEMTPMVKGEQWIFFLAYDEQKDNFMCVGDYQGRYPIPSQEVLDICNGTKEMNAELFGVYDGTLINMELYEEIMDRFQLGGA